MAGNAGSSSDQSNVEDVTHDALFDGTLRLTQPQKGYRYNVDSALLAAWVRARPPRTTLDIGAGVGVLGIAIAQAAQRTHRDARVLCVEQDAELARLCLENVLQNGLQSNLASRGALGSRCAVVDVHHGDVRELQSGAPQSLTPFDLPAFDAVVMNPPYFAAGAGRQNPNRQRAAARHQLNGSLAELFLAANALAPKACHYVVYPARFANAFFAALSSAGLVLDELVWVHDRDDQPATSLLARLVGGASAREVRVHPPFVLRDASGTQRARTVDVLTKGYFDPGHTSALQGAP